MDGEASGTPAVVIWYRVLSLLVGAIFASQFLLGCLGIYWMIMAPPGGPGGPGLIFYPILLLSGIFGVWGYWVQPWALAREPSSATTLLQSNIALILPSTCSAGPFLLPSFSCWSCVSLVGPAAIVAMIVIVNTSEFRGYYAGTGESVTPVK